ncbi:MAG: hypothetical protein ACYC4R_02980 [Anaerolineae bacterium]
MLEEIQLDTQLLAKQAALTHLQSQMDALQAQAAEMDAWMAAEIEKAQTEPGDARAINPPRAWLLISALLFALGLVAGDLICILWPLGFTALAVYMYLLTRKKRINESRETQIRAEHDGCMATIRSEQDALKPRIDELRASIDTLAREV